MTLPCVPGALRCRALTHTRPPLGHPTLRRPATCTPAALLHARRVRGAADLLQVASFQAFLFQATDLCLTLLVTFGVDWYPMSGLLWAAAALWFEVQQFLRADEFAQYSSGVGALGAYLVQDIFNALVRPWVSLPRLLGCRSPIGPWIETRLRRTCPRCC